MKKKDISCSERDFVESFLAMSFFRIPEFQNKLLEALQIKNTL
jgi:hypothetical protein